MKTVQQNIRIGEKKRISISIESIAREFQILGDFISAQPFGTGHINDTYRVIFNQGGTPVSYIFQRINHYVFKDPPALMKNILRVTEHIRTKLQAAQVDNPSRHVLTLVPTRDGFSYYKDADGNHWRSYIFINGARTYDILLSNDQARQAARIFGRFQQMLIDLPGPPLHETIPDFHNAPVRFRQFQQSLNADPHNRVRLAEPEIDFLLEQASIFDVLPNLVEKGEIPVRITHNDTKINNVMIDDETGEGICIIDLDTVMNGLSLYDFGDLARSTLSGTAEDERNLEKVNIDILRFKAVLQGYLSTADEFLNEAEFHYLVSGAKMMTLLIGMRFLIDFLEGDHYYKIQRENHNLDRCRVQFKLVQAMIGHESEMMTLVENLQFLKKS